MLLILRLELDFSEVPVLEPAQASLDSQQWLVLDVLFSTFHLCIPLRVLSFLLIVPCKMSVLLRIHRWVPLISYLIAVPWVFYFLLSDFCKSVVLRDPWVDSLVHVACHQVVNFPDCLPAYSVSHLKSQVNGRYFGNYSHYRTFPLHFPLRHTSQNCFSEYFDYHMA